MNCPRCQGCMVKDWLNEENQGGPALPCEKCLMCGHREDWVIRRHRLEQMLGVLHET